MTTVVRLQEVLGGVRQQGTITQDVREAVLAALGVSVSLRERPHGKHAGRRVLTFRAPPSVSELDFEAAVEWVHDEILKGGTIVISADYHQITRRPGKQSNVVFDLFVEGGSPPQQFSPKWRAARPLRNFYNVGWLQKFSSLFFR